MLELHRLLDNKNNPYGCTCGNTLFTLEPTPNPFVRVYRCVKCDNVFEVT